MLELSRGAGGSCRQHASSSETGAKLTANKVGPERRLRLPGRLPCGGLLPWPESAGELKSAHRIQSALHLALVTLWSKLWS